MDITNNVGALRFFLDRRFACRRRFLFWVRFEGLNTLGYLLYLSELALGKQMLKGRFRDCCHENNQRHVKEYVFLRNVRSSFHC